MVTCICFTVLTSRRDYIGHMRRYQGSYNSWSSPEDFDTLNPTTRAATATSSNYIYVAYQQGVYIELDWTDGNTVIGGGEPTIYNSPGVENGFGPGIAVVNGTIYLAWVADNGYVYVASSTDGHNFDNPIEVDPSHKPTSSPELVNWNNTLYVVYSTGSYNNPLVAQFNGTSFTSNIDTALELAKLSANGFNYDGTLLVGGQSYFSEDNLWLIASTTFGSWAPIHKYGQTLVGTPSFAVFGGYLYECEKSNYNNGLWCYFGG